MENDGIIVTPAHPAMNGLCSALADRTSTLDLSGQWPAEQLALLRSSGVYRWFAPAEWGGFGWSEAEQLRGYLRLSAACLTTTFVLTQWHAALRRILASNNESLKAELIPPLLHGETFTTVGISHLTTSRRHLAKPVLAAEESAAGFVLDGYFPWVTGAVHADILVTGATLPDNRQILIALPTNLAGLERQTPERLLALGASHTGQVRCHRVELARAWLLAGPSLHVLAQSGGAGGLQTSALAIGLTDAATSFVEQQAAARPQLADPAAGLRAEQQTLEREVLAAAAGESTGSAENLRARANSLALRAAQAALAVAKGTGYVWGHPAGRWCREALFFLVWSCPQPVMAANLCELAGIDG